MSKGFVGGVLASLLAGVILWFVLDAFERRPELSWFTVGTFQLPDEYAVEGQSDLHGDEASFQRILVIDNSGGLPARDVRLEIKGDPIGVTIQAPQGAVPTESMQGGRAYIIAAIAPREQIKVFISGLRFGEVEVYFEGATAPQVTQSHLIPTSGEFWLSTEDLPLVLVVPGMFTIIVFSLLFSAIRRDMKKAETSDNEKADNGD